MKQFHWLKLLRLDFHGKFALRAKSTITLSILDKGHSNLVLTTICRFWAHCNLGTQKKLRDFANDMLLF